MGRASRRPPNRLAQKLKIIRESLQLSQDGILKHLGFNDEDGLFRSSISGYELGTRLPPFDILLAYARAANVYVEVLIDDQIDLPTAIPAKKKSEGNRGKNSR